MAGCTPEQMPLALALAELLCRTKVAEELGKRQPPVLQIVVAGTATGKIGAPGSPGENAIGKLARLMLIHLACVPGPALEQKRIWAVVPSRAMSAVKMRLPFSMSIVRRSGNNRPQPSINGVIRDFRLNHGELIIGFVEADSTFFSNQIRIAYPDISLGEMKTLG